MRFQLKGDWPIQRGMVVPSGTILEGLARLSDGELVEAPHWNGMPVPLPLPVDTIALDNEAADQMGWFWPQSHHLLHCAPGVRRGSDASLLARRYAKLHRDKSYAELIAEIAVLRQRHDREHEKTAVEHDARATGG